MADVFPKLQDRRLSLVGRQLHRARKTTSIVNDHLKNKYSRYSRAVDRDKRSYDYKEWQKTLPIKNSLVQVKGTQKCLRKRRELTLVEDSDSKPFGMYDGVSLRELQGEIDLLINDAHPRTRRLKKADKLLTDGRRDGRILDNKTARQYLEDILKRPRFPHRRERGLYPDRPSSVDTNELTSASGLRLPPIAVSRENTKDQIYGRPKSRSVPSIFPNRSSTFAFESFRKR